MNRPTTLQSLIDRIEVPVEKGSVYAGAVKTFYLAAGSGQPVVLLHGAGAGAIGWYPVIGPLSAHYRVIAPDVVGYGQSEKPSALYDRSFFACWLKDFLDALGLQEASVLGHSLGGAIALQFALDNPERVDRLVLVDSAGLGRGFPLGYLLGMLWWIAFPSRVALWWLRRYTAFDPASIDRVMTDYVLEVSRMPGYRRAYLQGRGRAASPIQPEHLRRVNNSTLIVWGREDRVLPVAHAEAAQQAMPNARVEIIPNAGHAPFLDQPEAFNKVVLEFLKRRSNE